MSDHSQPTGPRSEPPPTSKQQRYLRQLAYERGVSFVPPRTRAEASRAIAELKVQRPDARVDQGRDRRAVQDQLAAGGDAARIRDDELDGYGSSANWAARS
jgi:hypothetical protein